jgi:hypothetical protein
MSNTNPFLIGDRPGDSQLTSILKQEAHRAEYLEEVLSIPLATRIELGGDAKITEVFGRTPFLTSPIGFALPIWRKADKDFGLAVFEATSAAHGAQFRGNTGEAPREFPQGPRVARPIRV